MNENSSLHLPEKYLISVHDMLKKHIPDATVLAYGSRVNGDYYEASDLDLAVQFKNNSANNFTRLENLRESFSESDLPIIIQIIDWNNISDSFRNEINANYVVIQKSVD